LRISRSSAMTSDFISWCRSNAGMTTWFLPEPIYCSSGRKKR
jgi:hypothetical protein